LKLIANYSTAATYSVTANYSTAATYSVTAVYPIYIPNALEWSFENGYTISIPTAPPPSFLK